MTETKLKLEEKRSDKKKHDAPPLFEKPIIGPSRVQNPTERRFKAFLTRRKEIINIVLLGVGFMFSMGSFSTCAMASTVILNNIHDEYFDGDSTIGYSLLCVGYATTAFTFLIAPSVSAIIGPKITVVTGATFLLAGVVVFLRPLTVTLYLGAVSQGLGQGLIWTVYGLFLSTNSTAKTIGRNTGIFWVIFVSNLTTGNLFYFYMLLGVKKLPESTRVFIYAVFIISAALGIVTLSLLQHPWIVRKSQKAVFMSLIIARTTTSSTSINHHGPLDALVAMVKLLFSKKMLLLTPTMIYSGLDLSFFMNLYGTSIGYTTAFGDDTREALAGLNGVFLGIGQMIGGLLFGSLGKCAAKRGRDPAMMVGMVTHILAYFLIYINIPGNATLMVTDDLPYIGKPSASLAMVCSLLFGFGDAAWINQVCALLGTLFKDDSLSAFACFQFLQCITTSAAFFYSSYLPMPYHILINITGVVLGAAGFCVVEWKAASSDRIKHVSSSNGMAVDDKKILPEEEATEETSFIYSKLSDNLQLVVRRQSGFDVIPSTLSEFS